MNMLTYPHLITSIALFFLITILYLHHTQQPPHQHQHHSLSPEGKLAFQEKTRLGSIPPSCHNKCNVCHPCMAVQVATTPGRKKGAVEAEPSRSLSSPTRTSNAMVYIFDPSPYSGRYSNYKPVGWKCRCGNHFYNP